MIEFHESEYSQSPLQEDTLRILLSFLPREVYDRLLYRRVKYVRLVTGDFSFSMEKRFQFNRIRYSRIRIVKAAEGQEAAEEVYPLAAGG